MDQDNELLAYETLDYIVTQTAQRIKEQGGVAKPRSIWPLTYLAEEYVRPILMRCPLFKFSKTDSPFKDWEIRLANEQKVLRISREEWEFRKEIVRAKLRSRFVFQQNETS